MLKQSLVIFVLISQTLWAQSPLLLNQHWFLKSDGLTESDVIKIDLQDTRDRSNWLMQVGNQTPTPLKTEISVDNLKPGDYTLRVYNPNLENSGASANIHVSYPLYVVVSTDWDDTRTGNRVLNNIEALHRQFHDLRLTHFFAPYHYTDPQISSARKLEIDRFIKRQRDLYGDEIGVHIHGWCHFIQTTGVPCRTAETFGTDDGTGYTTILAAYQLDEMTRILGAAVDMYAKHDLGRPRSFRAGGWTADETVFKALEANHFMVDSSAVPPNYLTPWKGYALYDWNMAHWSHITETSQPYFPGVNILEVPDNGVLVDYVSVADMINTYNLNHPGGGPLAKSTVYQIGFHPVDSFSQERYQRIVDTLKYVEKHSYAQDLGPVKYVTARELTQVSFF